MKVLIAISCLLAVASAGFLTGPAPLAAVGHAVIAVEPRYVGPQHLPVIGPNGVPLEPAENVAARAQHAAAKVEAAVRNGDIGIVAPAVAAPLAAAPLAAAGVLGAGIATPLAATGVLGAGIATPLGAHLAYAAPGAIYAPQHLPVIGPNGVPIEPAVNQIARAQHAASHIEAKVRNGDLAVLGRKRRGIVNSLAAPLAATTYAGLAGTTYAAGLAGLAGTTYAAGLAGLAAPALIAEPRYVGPQHIPVIGPNGVPLEPAENVAARAQHAVAKVEAAVRNGDVAIAAAPLAATTYAAGLAGPAVIAAQPAYLGPQHLPVIGPNGVPLEEPANVAARAQHAAAHVEAKARNGDLIAAVAAPAIATPLVAGSLAAAPALAYSSLGLNAHLAAKVAAGIL